MYMYVQIKIILSVIFALAFLHIINNVRVYFDASSYCPQSASLMGDDDYAETTGQSSTAQSEASRRHSAAAVPDFPPPAGKEYILRTSVPRPAPWSRPTPQRMYSIIMKNEFRLMGAFSVDTTFQ